ncbi:KOW domain-containing RNA-binding protein [Heliobacterium chlorum]|uniref:KOW domain-containing RNA-binding protein n=1 Tax=Heliobacterium chlorum TaxID=2698 RepID=A0ABR7T6I5_HELCL|nr:KOW domain-containing RNA-binding protein [Heliobacterium chlorum]MBC9785276.1 KOW domain-containing RNA-binding protein [Heliobacterium chlorum]
MAVGQVTPGQLVLSRNGRDQNRYFLVLKILDPDYLLIADGRYRKVDTPKKKKVKHLQLTELVVAEIGEMLQQGKTPTNTQVDSAIRQLLETVEVGL